MKRSAKLKSSVLQNQSLLKKDHRIKVTLNPLNRLFLTLQKVSSCPSDNFLEVKKNKGYQVRFLRFKQLKTKEWVDLEGLPVATVTYYVTIMTASCSAIIRVSFGTTILRIDNTAL